MKSLACYALVNAGILRCQLFASAPAGRGIFFGRLSQVGAKFALLLFLRKIICPLSSAFTERVGNSARLARFRFRLFAGRRPWATFFGRCFRVWRTSSKPPVLRPVAFAFYRTRYGLTRQSYQTDLNCVGFFPVCFLKQAEKCARLLKPVSSAISVMDIWSDIIIWIAVFKRYCRIY